MLIESNERWIWIRREISETGIDVGLLDEALLDADRTEIQRGLSSHVRDHAGVLEASEVGFLRDSEEAQWRRAAGRPA